MVKASRQGKIAALNRVGKFAILSDAGLAAGGENSGPSPHELLEAALASCTVITLQIFANRAGFPLEGAEAEVAIESESKTTSHLSRRIVLRGALSPEQKERLLQIADKCPIHNLLESQIRIESTVVEQL